MNHSILIKYTQFYQYKLEICISLPYKKVGNSLSLRTGFDVNNRVCRDQGKENKARGGAKADYQHSPYNSVSHNPFQLFPVAFAGLHENVQFSTIKTPLHHVTDVQGVVQSVMIGEKVTVQQKSYLQLNLLQKLLQNIYN